MVSLNSQKTGFRITRKHGHCDLPMMAEEMERTAIDAHLIDAGVGVLSLGSDADTYAVPESFGYDGECLYFQLVFDKDSTKMAFIDTTDMATFTVFTEDPPQSVLVRGHLEPVPEAEQTQAATAIAENANIPTECSP